MKDLLIAKSKKEIYDEFRKHDTPELFGFLKNLKYREMESIMMKIIHEQTGLGIGEIISKVNELRGPLIITQIDYQADKYKLTNEVVDHYRHNDIYRNIAYGEMDPQDSGVMRLTDVSHQIIDMDFGDRLYATLKILSTPKGKILNELWNAGLCFKYVLSFDLDPDNPKKIEKIKTIYITN